MVLRGGAGMGKSAEGRVSRRGKNARKAEAAKEANTLAPGGRASGEKELARGKFFGLKKWQYVAINGFLIFHILAICCWCMPFGSPFIAACRGALRPYFLWSGLFQSWDMFSPLPKATNAYMEALVLYKDGSTTMWSFPRMEQLSLTDRYSKERYRKFVETVLVESSSPLWPDVARYVARMPEIRENGPQKIMLVVKWSDVVAHEDGTFTRAPWDEHVFYSYDVKPEDLQ
jgi:hypothetical protein